MWRALFLAIGFFLMLLGVECLGVETINLKIHEKPPAPVSPFDTEPKRRRSKTTHPAALGPLEPAVVRRRDVPLLVHHPAKGFGKLKIEDCCRTPSASR